ncbi:hypothetical protein DGMP_01290 [Desulfomarina profundi]|uniref:PEP-CTERM protein-sorting domain-containing protein n=1 Tax=Desulfomarina profundi TaxID=2772557 RepID=A0A8D5JPY0_9BACT|nr:PEP-CTERM sorting domain-containing protein [Desulfomarina profundi]BCL59436.1 hypothetical protein DGMP_01290 [Desulfomarina profundi]
MNKYIVCMLLLFIPYQAQATPFSIEFTGVTAQLFDTPGYLEEGHGAGSAISFGGPAAMNIRGGARQFAVSCRTFIQYVSADFFIYDMAASFYESSDGFMADFTYIFYGNTIVNDDLRGTVPDISSAIKHSNVISLFGDGSHEQVASEPLELWLTPGTYWLGIEGGPARGLCYGSNIQLSGYPVPEPAAMLLFIMGIFFLATSIKKKY